MARMIGRIAVMGLVAGLGIGLGSTEALHAQVAKGTIQKKKGKTSKKGLTKPAMPDDAEAKPADVPVAAADSGGLKFSRDIAPILVANCAGCHKAGHRSGFDQTTFDGLMKGGKLGKEIVPGSPDESRLILRVKAEETPKMPPGQAQLAPGAIAKIEQWIKEGALLDSGVKSTEPMVKYAASPEDLRKAELAKLPPDQRDKKTEATARDRLKRADPKSDPEMTSSAHFLLFATMPKERATAVLKTMEGQYTKVGRLLSGPGGRGLSFGEKVSLYIFKDQKGFTEFARTVENQEVEPGEEARSKLGTESPYLIALDPLAGGAESASSLTRKVGKPKKGDDSSGGPERTLAGLLTEQLASGALAQAGKPPRWLTAGVGAWVASGVEPRSHYYRKLRAEALTQFNEGWQPKATEALGDTAKPEIIRAVGFAVVEWLASTNAPALPSFIHGMLEGGTKLDEVINACLNGNREDFLNGSGMFVEQHYASRR